MFEGQLLLKLIPVCATEKKNTIVTREKEHVDILWQHDPVVVVTIWGKLSQWKRIKRLFKSFK